MLHSNTPLNRVLELQLRKRALKEELRDVDAELATLQDVVQDYFAETGVDSIKIKGHTLALRRQLWAGRDGETVTAAEFAELLRAHPQLQQYARESCDTQGLSAYIRGIERELDSDDTVISMEDLRRELDHRFPGLGSSLKLTEKYDVSVTKSRENAARKRLADELADDEIPY